MEELVMWGPKQETSYFSHTQKCSELFLIVIQQHHFHFTVWAVFSKWKSVRTPYSNISVPPHHWWNSEPEWIKINPVDQVTCLAAFRLPALVHWVSENVFLHCMGPSLQAPFVQPHVSYLILLRLWLPLLKQKCCSLSLFVRDFHNWVPFFQSYHL